MEKTEQIARSRRPWDCFLKGLNAETGYDSPGIAKELILSLSRAFEGKNCANNSYTLGK